MNKLAFESSKINKNQTLKINYQSNQTDKYKITKKFESLRSYS